MMDMETLNESRTLVNEPTLHLDVVRAAIQTAFPFDDGHLVVRHIRTGANGTSWYRANWFRQRGHAGAYVDRSRFLAIQQTEEGLSVEDQTITGRTPVTNSSN